MSQNQNPFDQMEANVQNTKPSGSVLSKVIAGTVIILIALVGWKYSSDKKEAGNLPQVQQPAQSQPTPQVTPPHSFTMVSASMDRSIAMIIGVVSMPAMIRVSKIHES